MTTLANTNAAPSVPLRTHGGDNGGASGGGPGPGAAPIQSGVSRGLLGPQARDRFALRLLALSTLSVILPVVLVVYFLVKSGIPAINWEFISQAPSDGMTKGGIFPAIIGTVYLMVGTLVLAVPLGIGAAIYLSEYARRGTIVRIIRLAIVNLAGVPSIVYGLFGLGVFVLFCHFGSSILAGSCTLAILVLPMVITASEEALRQVPAEFRFASLGLGATKWQTTWRITLPNALPGILTGVILSMGRAAGETAPILFTCAAFYLPRLPKSILNQCMALPYHLYSVATQVPNAPQTIRWGTALVLLALVLGANGAAISLRIRARKARKW
jgi:phosphate transport system permease protein